MMFSKHILQWSIPTVLETLAKAGLISLAAYILPKDDFGIYTLAMLLYSFHPYIQLGVVEGLILKLPGYYVNNDINRIRSSLGLSLSYTISLLIALLTLALLSILLIYEYEKIAMLCGIYLLTSIPYQIYNHYILLNRYTYRFDITLYSRLINAALRILLQFPLVINFGIYGLVIGEFLIYTISTITIVNISRIHMNLNMNLKNLKGYIYFGFPVWIISLLTIFSVSFEKSISVYFFDIKTVADVGLLAFFGSILMLVNGQILSLFTQYAREFIVHTKHFDYLISAFLVFSLVSIIFYIINASVLYGFLSKFFIPKFLPEYVSVISYFPVIYCIFLIRILVANFVSYFLVVDSRVIIIISHALFFLGSLFGFILLKTFNDFKLIHLWYSILTGLILEFIFIFAYLSFTVGSSLVSFLIIFYVGVNLSYALVFFNDPGFSWIINFLLNITVAVFLLYAFKNLKSCKDIYIIFKAILKKEYLIAK